MPGKTDFTAEEWQVLRDTPSLVAAAVMLAGGSGLGGSFAESVAAGTRIYDGAKSSDALVKAIAAPDETRAAQARLKELLPLSEAARAPEKMRALALESLPRALAILNGKGFAAEADAFRAWCEEIATAVAKAGSEGGFLGFGGERVSGAERELLAALAAAAGGTAKA